MKQAIITIYDDKIEVKDEKTGEVFSNYYYKPRTLSDEMLNAIKQHLEKTGWNCKVYALQNSKSVIHCE